MLRQEVLLISFLIYVCFLLGERGGAAVSTIVTEILVHCILVYYLRTIIPIKWLLNKIVRFVTYGAIPFFIFKSYRDIRLGIIPISYTCP